MVSTTYQLTMRSGPTPGKIFPLEKDELLLGRDLSSDIVINDAGVSRRHSHLVKQVEGYVLEDLGSTNGTSVSGQRLMGPYQLHSGEAFTLGESVTLVYEAITFDPDATVASPRMQMPQSQPTPTGQAPVQPMQQMPPVQPVQPVQQVPVQQVPPMQQMPQAQQQAPQPMQQPVTPPPPVYSAPVTPPPPVQPSYVGQVPAGPAQPQAPAKKKGGFPVWIIIVIVILLLLCICVGGGLYYIDSHNMWCQVMPFIPGCQ